MRRDEAQAPEALDAADPAEQLAQPEALGGLPVGVDRLPEQRDLGVAVSHEVPDLVDDLGGGPAALPAPGERHDAERAVLVAALDHGDVGLERRTAADLAKLVDRILLGKLQPQRLAAFGPRGRDELADPLDLPGARHEVDERRPLQDLGAGNLGDAAGDADDEVRVLLLAPGEDAERAEDLVLRLFAHRAGVEDDDLRGGLVGALGGPPDSEGLELARHALAVEDVHLAAPRLHAVRVAVAAVDRRGNDGQRCLAHSRIHPGRAPALRARSGRSARFFSASASWCLASSRSEIVRSQAGLITRSRYWPSSQA